MASLLFSRDYTSVVAYRDQCTKSTCPLDQSYWAYLPSLAANGLFLGLFSLSLILFIAQSILSRRFLGFTIAVVSGCILEMLGYVGRILSWYNPFYQNGYLIQIICLTIAPAFYAAALYLTLSRIVLTFGPANSRIKPLSYPRIFIPCDLVSLLLQAGGGGYASAQSHANKSPELGNHILVAGLAFQVLTLFIFMGLAADFGVRTFTRYRKLGAEQTFDQSHDALRRSRRFQGFLFAIAFATVCIFTRSVYRVAELSEGWDGHLIKTQKYFIGLEGAIVSAAVLSLNVFHPGFCFREGDSRGRKGFGFGKRGGEAGVGREKVGTPESEPPVMNQVGEI